LEAAIRKLGERSWHALPEFALNCAIRCAKKLCCCGTASAKILAKPLLEIPNHTRFAAKEVAARAADLLGACINPGLGGSRWCGRSAAKCRG